MIVLWVLALVYCALCCFYVAVMVWSIKPYRALNWFCHDILKWHIPDGTIEMDKRYKFYSRCRICGKKIYKMDNGEWVSHEIDDLFRYFFGD